MGFASPKVGPFMWDLTPQNRSNYVGLDSSVVRGEAKETSDVDFLVIFGPEGTDFFTLYDLEQFLESKLKTKVDLGTKLHPMLKDQIMREALRVA